MKNTGTARAKSYDAGKKASGSKRNLAVDKQGLPHAIAVTTADVNGHNSTLLMFLRNDETLCEAKTVLVDGAYTGARFEELAWQILSAKVEVIKPSELHQFAVHPKRWVVVERSFAWLEKCRRLRKNCERKLDTSGQLVALAFLALLLRRH